MLVLVANSAGLLWVFAGMIDRPRVREFPTGALTVDPNTIDLGEVSPGKHPVVFRLTNTGSTAIRILSVLKTCGCTSVDFDATKYEAGDSFDLRCQVELENGEEERLGLQVLYRNADMTSDDSDRLPSVLDLEIIGRSR